MITNKKADKAQAKVVKKTSKRLEKFGIALLWGQIRAGKTRPILLSSKGYRTLICTKKDAINGIKSEANALGIEVDVINYHSIDKMNPDDYDLIWLDETHLYVANASPKESTTWKKVREFTKGKKVGYASGTPSAEGYGGLYHMLKLSDNSPFKGYPSFTMWFFGFTIWKDTKGVFKAYSLNYRPAGRNIGARKVKQIRGFGIPTKTYLGDKEVPSYKETEEKRIKKAIEHLVVRLKRVDTGHKFEAKDVTHYLKSTKEQSKLLRKLADDLIVETKQGIILGDTPVKLLQKRHQISSGIAVKCEDDELYRFKKESPKVNFIKKHFDPNTTIILAHYIEEQEYLAKIFPHTGSVTKMSSGVDLSHFETMVIFSMAFSAANYEQVRGRLMNVNRKTKIKVHYLLIDVDEYVYNCVKGKENFTASWFRGKEVEEVHQWV